MYVGTIQEFFPVVKIYIVILGFMTSCTLGECYRRFGRSCWYTTNMRAINFSEKLVSLMRLHAVTYHTAGVSTCGTRILDAIISWSHTVRSFASDCVKWRLCRFTQWDDLHLSSNMNIWTSGKQATWRKRNAANIYGVALLPCAAPTYSPYRVHKHRNHLPIKIL